jgi:hypothetical protein
VFQRQKYQMTDLKTHNLRRHLSAVTKVYLAKLPQSHLRAVTLHSKTGYTQDRTFARKQVHILKCRMELFKIHKTLF